MTKVCFVDVDGPLIPTRAYFLPNQTTVVSIFDPCAVSLLLKIVEQSSAQLVVSSTWRSKGYDRCMELFEKNGISRNLFHTDWSTPRKMTSSRTQEICWWLAAHPEITHYVAIDDEHLDYDLLPNTVQCDEYEGFSWRNYMECCVFLESYGDFDTLETIQTQIEYNKRREIWRTKRKGEPGAYLTWQAADLVFPRSNNQTNG